MATALKEVYQKIMMSTNLQKMEMIEVNMMIESESLKKYISSLLNKSADELTVEDLNKIDYISLKKMNALYQETDCITGDLIQFKNLKGCTLFKFDV